MTPPIGYITFPDWISPVIIPGLPLRWYGMMYLVAFALAYLLIRIQIRQEKQDLNSEILGDFFFWVILGILLGGRLASALIYDTSGLYWTKPWLIFWPFDGEMNFTGLQGMSYHGGLAGGIVAGVIFCRRKGLPVWRWADRIALAIPLGYTFGRLGNFINGELYGRVSTAPWGMIFPRAERFPLRFDWVSDIANRLGIEAAGVVNLPRHPSQLYEALGEGVLLWLLLWFVLRNRKSFDGFLSSWYLIGYGVIRFFIEYFRQPDANLGFILQLGPDQSIYQVGSLLNFTMGQLLCLLMIAAGTLLFFVRRSQTAV